MAKAFSLLVCLAFLFLLDGAICRQLSRVQHIHHRGQKEFRRLLNLERGTRHAGLPPLRQYLHQFGYLDINGHEESRVDRFDKRLEDAISRYQRFFKLNITGTLDAATVHTLSLPRCGNPDITNGSTTRNNSRLLYKIASEPWPASRRSLTYFIYTQNQPYSAADLSKAFGGAFKTWADVSPFKFTETSDEANADLYIGFFFGAHGDNCPNFDGPNGVLGFSYYPQDGRSHYDAGENWMVDPAKLATTVDSYDIQTVATHEIGHLLGLDHSTLEEAMMYPILPSGSTKLKLAGDDVEGIQALYNES